MESCPVRWLLLSKCTAPLPHVHRVTGNWDPIFSQLLSSRPSFFLDVLSALSIHPVRAVRFNFIPLPAGRRNG
jgi:hypothetical protein